MLLVSYCYLLVERGDYAIVRNAPFVIQQAHGFRPCRAVAILKKRPEQLCLLCCGKRMENAPQSFRFRVPVHRIAWRRRVNSRSEEHTSELQSLMRISYAVFCLKKKKTK